MPIYEQIIQAYRIYTVTHVTPPCKFDIMRHLSSRFPDYKFQLYVSTKLRICAKKLGDMLWFEIDDSNPYHLIYLEGVESR